MNDQGLGSYACRHFEPVRPKQTKYNGEFSFTFFPEKKVNKKLALIKNNLNQILTELRNILKFKEFQTLPVTEGSL
jgi:hypothetical protein